MLGNLARWLRILGLDTEYLPHEDDDELIERALKEKRIILTRDRGLLERAIKRGASALLIKGERLEVWLAQLARKYCIRLVIDPNKSRCPHCNTLLKHVLASEFEELNITTWRPPVNKEEYWICPTCKQIYWRGKHFRSILNILKRAKEISKLLDINSR